MAFAVQIRRTLKQIPLVASCMAAVHRVIFEPPSFRTSERYWKARYRKRGNSGAGSYGQLAEFKARVLNEFVREQGIRSVIEWGCGDGNQQTLAAYPKYTGVDISRVAVKMCRATFSKDSSKCFMLYPEAENQGIQAELALSLDVIYHLVEDRTFENYMRALSRSGTRFLGIYSSDRDEPGTVPHVRHRSFSAWLQANAPQWQSVRFVENQFKYDPADPDRTSWSDFRFFERRP